MKRIKRYISPAILSALGIWIIVDKASSLTIMGIILVVMGAVGIALQVTDKESSKTSKTGHCVLDGAIGAGGMFLLFGKELAGQYLHYILGGLIVLYSGFTLRRMMKYHYKPPFQILQAAAVAVGLAVAFIPWDPSVVSTVGGGGVAFTGIVTLLGQLLGKPGKRKEQEKNVALAASDPKN